MRPSLEGERGNLRQKFKNESTKKIQQKKAAIFAVVVKEEHNEGSTVGLKMRGKRKLQTLTHTSTGIAVKKPFVRGNRGEKTGRMGTSPAVAHSGELILAKGRKLKKL